MFKINIPYHKDSRVALLVRNRKANSGKVYQKKYRVMVYYIQGISGTPQYESTYYYTDLRTARKFLSVIATDKIYDSTGFFTRLLKEI